MSCNTSLEKTSITHNINSQVKLDTIKLNIKSPSNKCFYELVINEKGEGFYSITKSNSVKEKIKIIDNKDYELVLNLISELKTKEPYEGKLWKDGWMYMIFLNESRKISVYKKQESKYITDLIKLFEKYCKINIDYSCF
jgi:hypothetical protein